MAKWVVLLSMLVAGPAFAGERLDVEEWLSRPGVKLLAVEFYATWCVPCKKAVPRWKWLHERYRDQGLRLVVVSVQEREGWCPNPGWNPDDVVCDANGELAKAWRVGELPAAFLWSWRGILLVRHGHIDEVERVVEREMARLPRVTLDKDMNPYLREMLRTELAKMGKVDVVAEGEEEEALAAIQEKSHQLRFSEGSACPIGDLLAPNSLLKAKVVQSGAGRQLLLHLFNAQTGCLDASAGVFWNEQRPALSVAKAVSELVNNLRVAVQLPGKEPADEEETIARGTLQIEARDTRGNRIQARVILDGKAVGVTPYKQEVVAGAHHVRVVLGDSSWSSSVTVGRGQVRQLYPELEITEKRTSPDRVVRKEQPPSGTFTGVQIGASFAEGAVTAGDQSKRSAISGSISTWVGMGDNRWEPVSLGISFEEANTFFVGTGYTWGVVVGLYLRSLIQLAFSDGIKYFGLLGGLGYGFNLGGGWNLDVELDGSWWPSFEALVLVGEGRMGVRYVF